VEDIDYLAEHFVFHPLALEDCLSRIERPKIDEFDDHLFIVLHFPMYDTTRRISRPREVDFFIGRNYLVTLHDGILRPLNNFYRDCQENESTRERYMGRGASTLLHAVIDRLVDYLFPILYKVDSQISEIEDDIFEDDTRDIVREISLVRRDIIALRRIIRPQIPIITNLSERERPFIREELDDYFDDVLDHMYKVRDLLDENYEVIADLSETTDSLLSHRINEVMRVLTVLSVIMLPLTLLSGIYGMNVRLPFEGDPYAFWGLMGFMAGVFITMIGYFRYRGWL
jgi:magnesium transporter